MSLFGSFLFRGLDAAVVDDNDAVCNKLSVVVFVLLNKRSSLLKIEPFC